MSKKVRTTINIDKDILRLLKMKYKGSASEFFENQAREYIFGNPTTEKLREEISQMEVELSAKKGLLKEQQKMQEINDSNEKLINKAMNTIHKILLNQSNEIGLNQIDDVAYINGLSVDILKFKIREDETVKIKPIYELTEN